MTRTNDSLPALQTAFGQCLQEIETLNVKLPALLLHTQGDDTLTMTLRYARGRATAMATLKVRVFATATCEDRRNGRLEVPA